MATITVRQLDDATVARLKERAASKGSSMEQEARQILTREVATDWDAIRKRLAERRASWGRVLSDSVEIIREMREERDRQLDEAISGRRP